MTTGSIAIIQDRYDGPHHFEHTRSVVVVADSEMHLGLMEPTLLEPIDYDAEIAERSQTHEPIRPVDGDIGNSLFGI